MSVQLKFFNVPFSHLEEAEEKLNIFLRSVRVVDMERHFVEAGSRSFWAVAVEFHTGSDSSKNKKNDIRTKVDYKSLLSQDEFAVFARLRDWRKDEAAREGIPVYVIFTNEQLAQIAKLKPAALGQLKKIDGVGDARIEKYGAEVCKLISAFNLSTPLEGEV